MNLLTDEEIEYYLNKLKSDVKLENHIAELEPISGIYYASKKLHISKKYMKVIYDLWRREYVSRFNCEEVRNGGHGVNKYCRGTRRKPKKHYRTNRSITQD